MPYSEQIFNGYQLEEGSVELINGQLKVLDRSKMFASWNPPNTRNGTLELRMKSTPKVLHKSMLRTSFGSLRMYLDHALSGR